MPGFELIGKEELAEIQSMFNVGKGNLYRYGPGCHAALELEKRFAEYMGVRYAHAVSSGTAAIHSALAALEVGPGDEVITTSFTFVAPVEAIVALGATPVPVEIDDTYHLDPDEVARVINKRTKAVVVIPMWSAPKMDELVDVCNQAGVPMIEDAAQCLGGAYKGRKLGTFGRLGTFSFDMGKSITTGEGGIVVTSDEELYKRVAEFSDHGHMHIPGLPRGQDPRRTAGLNYRISELAGAVGLAQLKKLDHILSRQRSNKGIVKHGISSVPGLKFRKHTDEEGSPGDTLIFRLSSEEATLKLARFLEANSFGSKILPEAFEWHFAGMWTHIFDRFPSHKGSDLISRWPKTYKILKTSIALPIMVNMSDERIKKLIGLVNDQAEITCSRE